MKEVKYESKWLEYKENCSFCKYATIILQLGDKIKEFCGKPVVLFHGLIKNKLMLKIEK